MSSQSISKALKNNNKSKGWIIKKSEDLFYKKSIMLNNLNLFDDNFHPQPNLIAMLKTL